MEQHTATADPKSKPVSFDADHAIARTLVIEQLIYIQSLTSSFGQYFSKCDAKEFEGASAIFHELDPIEKGLDRWLTSLRGGEMNERACSENLHG
jgi:Dynein associated protein